MPSFVSATTQKSILTCNSIKNFKKVLIAICQDYLAFYPKSKEYPFYKAKHNRQACAEEIITDLQENGLFPPIKMPALTEQTFFMNARKKFNLNIKLGCVAGRKIHAILQQSGNGELHSELDKALDQFIKNLEQQLLADYTSIPLAEAALLYQEHDPNFHLDILKGENKPVDMIRPE